MERVVVLAVLLLVFGLPAEVSSQTDSSDARNAASPWSFSAQTGIAEIAADIDARSAVSSVAMGYRVWSRVEFGLQLGTMVLTEGPACSPGVELPTCGDEQRWNSIGATARVELLPLGATGLSIDGLGALGWQGPEGVGFTDAGLRLSAETKSDLVLNVDVVRRFSSAGGDGQLFVLGLAYPL